MQHPAVLPQDPGDVRGGDGLHGPAVPPLAGPGHLRPLHLPHDHRAHEHPQRPRRQRHPQDTGGGRHLPHDLHRGDPGEEGGLPQRKINK